MRAVWYNSEVDFIGGVGMKSIREFAQEIVKDSTLKEVFENLDAEFTPKGVHEALLNENVSVLKVPDHVFDKEVWEDDEIYRISEKSVVGKGYKKVFGFSL